MNIIERDFQTPAKTSPYPVKVKKWAIIVGISKYKDEGLNLKYADRDAEELYELLLSPLGGGFEEDHIKKLINTEATTLEIQRALRSFVKRADRDDIFMIYFACHGSQDLNYPNSNIIYLLSHDTDPNDISGTALRMDEINLSLKDYMQARHVIIIADTCHSAAMGNETNRRSLDINATMINKYLQAISNARGGVALLTSAEANESSLEGDRWGGGHGVFTHFLLKGMRGDAYGYLQSPREGIVTVGELFEYIRDKVREETGYKQHPVIGPNPFDRNLPVAICTQQKIPEIEFVLIPAGEFIMGSPSDNGYRSLREKPLHKVTIKNSFLLGKYPVTQGQWVKVMGKYNYPSFKDPDLPVSGITWEKIQEFMKRLNQGKNIQKYRLPSEAEWEYACRAGTDTKFHFGDDESELDEYAWYRKNTVNYITHPVGQKKPNPWGLYDMYGNIWELVQDIEHNNFEGAPDDGSAWEDGEEIDNRVIRGGSYVCTSDYCRSACRIGISPVVIDPQVGFRLLQEL